MSKLKEFKIGLRPHEEFFFQTQNPGGLTPDHDKENKKYSPNFGGTSRKSSLKASLKPSVKNSHISSVVNMNNYVS
jgi:hypothetical protein